MKRNKNFFGHDSDDDYMAEEQALGRSNGGRTARRTAVAQTPRSAGRSRPTNNQLLYKAYFRWTHYLHKLRNGTAHLPTETDACPSVTAAFLQVLHTLNLAEGFKAADQRNILQLLSNNTRRTKVVELSTGTHRVPDELRKHYLSDGEGGQYSTNLDRNRYGNDDQYLFTVIRYDLEFLGLCPCMVDVEIIDAKNDNQSIFVSAGQEACICTKYPGMLHDPGYAMQHFAPRSRGGIPPLPGAPEALPGLSQGQPVSPRRSGSQISLAFDALVMAATGGTEGAAAAAGGGEAPVESRLGGPLAAAGLTPGSGSLEAAAAAAAMAASVGRSAGQAVHQLPSRQRSRLWSALSYGDVDSLQNALDAFRAEDEIASGPGLSDTLAQAGAVAAAAPQPSSSESYRRRQRKPVRGPSSSNILAQPVDLLAGMSAADRTLLSSLVKGVGPASDLRDVSGDNAAQADVVSSGAVQDGAARRTSSAGPGRSTGSQGARATGSAGLPPHQPRISFRPGDQDEQLSQEDDSEPVTGGRSGGKKSGSGAEATGYAGGGLGTAGEGCGDEGALGEVGLGESLAPGGAAEGVGDAGEADMGADDDDDADAAAAGMDGPPPLARRVRHVPRQSSAINLATRVGPAEMKRMAAEVETLRAENRLLRQAAGIVGAGYADDEFGGLSAGSRVAVLEQELASLRQQVVELMHAKRAADEQILQLNQELMQTRNTANQVLHHALMKEASALGSPPAAAAAAGAGLSRQGNGIAAGFGGHQAALPLNPIAALASGPLQNLLAGMHNPAAAAAALAAAAMAAAAASGGTAGAFDPQQLLRSSINPMQDLGQYVGAAAAAGQEQQQHATLLPPEAAADQEAATDVSGKDTDAADAADAGAQAVTTAEAQAVAEGGVSTRGSEELTAAANNGCDASHDVKATSGMLTAAAAPAVDFTDLALVVNAVNMSAVKAGQCYPTALDNAAATAPQAGTVTAAAAAAAAQAAAEAQAAAQHAAEIVNEQLDLRPAAAAAVLSLQQQQLVAGGVPVAAASMGESI